MAIVMAAVPNPVAETGVAAFLYLAGAFVVGALLFQFRFRAIWCLVACEAVVLFYYFDILYRVDLHMQMLWFGQFVVVPVFLVPTYLGYYFNKHIIHS